ncbi:thioredoxin [Arthrobacter sp. ISL-30]|uniref:thioredoxin n=1 Tax=Arthrobacter sp. ISL-30 TaxID=2819109 RepID=UPI001BE6DE46|nr:thioredoxin [Arthrobacter sp. ISL-30]MBT2515670.1 thioredoxin [Arthrobacter sp. ISL-30]
MGKIRDITDASFGTEVLTSLKPVIVDFWAVWCAPCIRLSPELEQLAEDYNDKVEVVKVNVDENPKTAAEFGISSIPAVYLFKDGQPKISVVGARPKQFFEKEFADYLQ